MTSGSRRWRGLFALTAALALSAVSCGNDDDTPGTDTSAATSETTAPSESSVATDTTAATDTVAPDTAATDTAAPDTAATTDTAAPDTAAAAPSGDPLGPVNEATGDPIKIGYFNDGTTPAVDHADDNVVAKATVAFLNKHRGGIGGRPIELVMCETKSDPAIATDCGNQFVEQKVAAVLTGTSGFSDTVWDPVNAAGIPFVCAGCAVDRLVADGKNTFLLVNGLAQTHAFPTAVAKREGITKIASLVIDVPAAVTPMANAVAAATAAGFTFDVVAVPPGTADMLPQVTAAMTKDPELIQIIGDPAFCLVALRALNDADFKGIVQTADYCINAKTFEPLPPEAVKDLRVSATVAMGDNADPDWVQYQAIMQTFGERQPEVSGVRGWTYQTIMAFVLGLDGIDAAGITPASIATSLHAAPEQKMPLGGGITFKCDGSKFTVGPAFCTNSTLETKLDDKANFTSYTLVDTGAEVSAIADFLAKGGAK